MNNLKVLGGELDAIGDEFVALISRLFRWFMYGSTIFLLVAVPLTFVWAVASGVWWFVDPKAVWLFEWGN